VRLRKAKWAIPISVLSSLGCTEPAVETVEHFENLSPPGLQPNIKVGAVPPGDADALESWIEEAVSVLQSPEFEMNFHLASQTYPTLFVSKKEDLVPSETVLSRLKTNDPRMSALWWPETFVTLSGPRAIRSEDRTGFGFEASRKAVLKTLPIKSDMKPTGQIDLGRLHFARYTRGGPVEKSCALNTMVHEISHSLSERRGEFWMHILDSEINVTAPRGTFEASYFIGAVAQCTYLQSIDRVSDAKFHTCLKTFSDPQSGSRFKSLACDDFPNSKPITPQGRLLP